MDQRGQEKVVCPMDVLHPQDVQRPYFNDHMILRTPPYAMKEEFGAFRIMCIKILDSLRTRHLLVLISMVNEKTKALHVLSRFLCLILYKIYYIKSTNGL